ncbi:KpsF/GutQ family sugar-phosphate isomerase [Croceibacterium ferulae]|uniref:KpsF/GutQ family sugar-phosphate isomerase n=1 Tax=Croceibacterium ferulae TaxID=1854641 RepID=UPI001F4ED455|nr:KpsF/GutQ family sugar-phosphate isomerase [Croceibacterium ferulae]
MIVTLPDAAILADEAILARGAEVLQIESEALQSLRRSLDDSFVNACKTILAAKGRVVVTGIGKSGHIGRKAAATFSATGTPASYVHPGEAAHGDLGMLVAGDALIVISNSGNTSELQAFLTYARAIGVPVIGIASRPGSLVMRHADVQLCIPVEREACNANIAPTTSTTLQLALCDALAMSVMDMRGFSQEGMKLLHPGGAIGLRLLPVSEMMHTGPEMPLITADTSMADVLSVMTSRGFGIAGIVNDARELLGVITDGDLRRNFERLQSCSAGDVMTLSPKTLACDMSAETALEVLNDQKITAAFVHEPGNTRPVGIVHIHDFVRVGLS